MGYLSGTIAAVVPPARITPMFLVLLVVSTLFDRGGMFPGGPRVNGAFDRAKVRCFATRSNFMNSCHIHECKQLLSASVLANEACAAPWFMRICCRFKMNVLAPALV